MRIALDSGPLESGHKIRGVGFYTQSLIDGLKALNTSTKLFTLETFNFEKESARLSEDFDAIHIPYFNPFINTLPDKKRTKIIVTVHDLIPLIYPNHYVPGFRGTVEFLKHKRKIRRDVDAIITDTETSKKDVVRLLQFPESQVFPVHLAPGEMFRVIKSKNTLSSVRAKYNLPPNFVLYVGDINYNKNIPNLVNACMLANIPLVMVGKQALELNDLQRGTNRGPRDVIRGLLNKPHPEVAHWNELRRVFENNTLIHRLGFVSDEDLVSIFNIATVYCQPSLYEGFGLPVLQAMACGTPVVAARTQALVEVAAEAALYADPYKPEDISARLVQVVSNERDRNALIIAGEHRVQKFTWKKTAEETLAVYKKICNA